MTQIQKITVKGYKSIEALENFELRSLNVLIGANGAGKSNFIGLFNFLHAMYEQQLQIYVQKQGGIDAFLHFGRKVTPRMEMAFWFPERVERGRLTLMAEELAASIARNKVVDWKTREAVQARLRNIVRVVLRKYGYPQAIREQIAEQVLNLAKLTDEEGVYA
ncbi:MAG: type I restriction enzyme endonuclease domain-containing protein [Azovibrio sp.]|uniref:AAA family ATPase n=1 Tax=Azovibrio sp. TaxID=1872673 RepID=UPI003C787C00